MDYGSGVALRRVDYGSRSTRTLFQGDDLAMSAGSGIVTSARGGFSGVLTELDSLNDRELAELNLSRFDIHSVARKHAGLD
ncbi:MAG: hypothetical protein EBU97_04925 [Rhodobacteraceae bacterium]|nr:hypothetical protein [Paracoccaceae bacterium]